MRPAGRINVREVISATLREWMEDKVQRLGAALAFYAAFSIAPLLVIVIFIANAVYAGDSLVQVHRQIDSLIGTNAADAVVTTMRALQSARGGTFATIISVIVLFIGATAVFGSLQDAMNTIWEVTPKQRHFIVDILRTRFFSFVMVICFCLLLIFSLAASATLAIVTKYFESYFPGNTLVWKVADSLLTLVLTTIVFATMYKVLPDVRLHWSDVAIGAASTAILFTLGRIPLGLYLKNSALSSAYGAAGSIMILLLWVYYTAQILFLGAEFTQVYANRYGSRVVPARGAVFTSEAARSNEGIPHAETIRDAVEDARPRRTA